MLCNMKEKAMSFDTTAATQPRNTGVQACVAVWIEQKLNGELLRLVRCRHIFEAILADFFPCLFEYSSGLDIAILNVFKA